MTQSADEWLTIPEIVRAARAKLPANIWHYSCGGAESETTLRRNRSAFDYLALRPRILQGAGHPDTSVTFLGQQMSLPVMLAPVGSIVHFDPDGALAAARAAEAVGTGAFVGTLSTPSLEDVRAGADGPLYFQLYVRGDRDWIEGIVRRAERAGYEGICLTADSGAYGRRERDLHNRFFPRERGNRPNLGDVVSGADRGDYQGQLTWDDVAWLRETTRLPLMVKGILGPEDASAAVDRGVDVVYISNHGGRQLDHGPSTIEVLPDVAQAVGGQGEHPHRQRVHAWDRRREGAGARRDRRLHRQANDVGPGGRRLRGPAAGAGDPEDRAVYRHDECWRQERCGTRARSGPSGDPARHRSVAGWPLGRSRAAGSTRRRYVVACCPSLGPLRGPASHARARPLLPPPGGEGWGEGGL